MEHKVFADNVQQFNEALDELTFVMYGETGLPLDEEDAPEEAQASEGDEGLEEEGVFVDVMDFEGNFLALNYVSCKYEDVQEFVDCLVYNLEVRQHALLNGALDGLDADGLRKELVAVCEQLFCLARCYQDGLAELLHALFNAKASLCGAAVEVSMNPSQELLDCLECYVSDDSSVCS